MKECNKCHVTKPLTDYTASKRVSDGRSRTCRICTKTERQRKNAERLQASTNVCACGCGTKIFEQKKYALGHWNWRKPNAAGEYPCSLCGEHKPATQFPLEKKGRDNVGSRCKPCSNEAARGYRERNPDAYMRADLKCRLKRRYGLSMADYERLGEKQGWVCAICQGPPKDSRALHIDHCHDTGAIRGLLCNTCNTGIGGLRDDVALLTRAISYITNPPWPLDST